MAFEHRQLTPALRLPDPHRSVLPAAHHITAVAAPAHAQHPPGVKQLQGAGPLVDWLWLLRWGLGGHPRGWRIPGLGRQRGRKLLLTLHPTSPQQPPPARLPIRSGPPIDVGVAAQHRLDRCVVEPQGHEAALQVLGVAEDGGVVLQAHPVGAEGVGGHAQQQQRRVLQALFNLRGDQIAGLNDPLIKPHPQPGLAQPLGQLPHHRLVGAAVAEEDVVAITGAQGPGHGGRVGEGLPVREGATNRAQVARQRNGSNQKASPSAGSVPGVAAAERSTAGATISRTRWGSLRRPERTP